jgi:hypothetical protein
MRCVSFREFLHGGCFRASVRALLLRFLVPVDWREVAVALIWLVSDRRIERAMAEQAGGERGSPLGLQRRRELTTRQREGVRVSLEWRCTMETTTPDVDLTREPAVEVTEDGVIRSLRVPGLELRPLPPEVLEKLRADLPVLRAHRQAILARRGGKPFTEEELTGALHEARAAHERGE